MKYRILLLVLGCLIIVGLSFYWINHSKSEIIYIEVEEYLYKRVGEPMLKKEIVANEVYRDKDLITDIITALKDITIMKGTLDIKPHDHLINVVYDNGKAINYKVWINDIEFKHGIVEIEREYYHINEKGTKILRDILN